MKKIKFIALMLAILQLIAVLSACGAAGEGGGKGNGGISKVKGQTLDEVMADLEEKGAVGAVISVYEEKEDDGAVFVSGNYKSAAKGDYVTVAVNDLSMKEKLVSTPEAPRFLSTDVYNELVATMEPADSKKLYSFYNEVNGVMFVVPDAVAKELNTLYEIFEKYGFNSDRVFEEYVKLGFVPSLESSIEAVVATKDNCAYTETDYGIIIKNLNENSSNIVIPDEIDSKPVVGVELENFFTYPEFVYSVTLGKNVKYVSSLGKNTSSLYNINVRGKNSFINNSIVSDYVVTDANGYVSLDRILLGYKGNAFAVKIPANVNFVASSAFQDNNTVKSVAVHNNVYTVADSAFSGCTSLEKCILPEKGISLSGSVFYNCSSLSEINLPTDMTEISAHLFSRCSSLSQIQIPEGVTAIGDSAFYGCASLESIRIPKNVTYIGYSVVRECPLLNRIYIEDLAAYCSIDFGGRLAEVPSTLYLNDTIVNELIIPDGIKSIDSGAFANIVSIKSVTIPSSVESIGQNAFENCSTLRAVKGCENVTNIEQDAFGGCTALESIGGLGKVELVGRDAFKDTKWLKAEAQSSEGGFVIIGNGVLVSYEGNAKEVVVPENVTEICYTAFTYAKDMTSLTINGKVTSLNLYCNDALEKLVIPATVTEISYLNVPSHKEPNEFDNIYVEGTTIYCEAGTAASEYAEENEIPFVITD